MPTPRTAGAAGLDEGELKLSMIKEVEEVDSYDIDIEVGIGSSNRHCFLGILQEALLRGDGRARCLLEGQLWAIDLRQ